MDQKISDLGEIDAFKAAHPEKIKVRINQGISEISELLREHLTEEEVDDLLEFFTSPAGRRLLELAPIPIFQQEMIILAAQCAREIIKEVKRYKK